MVFKINFFKHRSLNFFHSGGFPKIPNFHGVSNKNYCVLFFALDSPKTVKAQKQF